MHQSERVTSTSGGLEEGEESDPESWPGDSTSPTDSEFFNHTSWLGQICVNKVNHIFFQTH